MCPAAVDRVCGQGWPFPRAARASTGCLADQPRTDRSCRPVMTTSRAERGRGRPCFVQGLSAQFAALDAALVQQVVRDTRRRFDGHPTREFVPILVEDSARDRLRVTPPGATPAVGVER